MTVHWSVALALSLALHVGCAASDPFSRDERIAARQVSEILPKGTWEARATKVLTERGFSLARLSSGSTGDHLLVGSRVVGTTYWQVGVVIVSAKVASTTVKISDVSVTSK